MVIGYKKNYTVSIDTYRIISLYSTSSVKCYFIFYGDLKEESCLHFVSVRAV